MRGGSNPLQGRDAVSLELLGYRHDVLLYQKKESLAFAR